METVQTFAPSSAEMGNANKTVMNAETENAQLVCLDSAVGYPNRLSKSDAQPNKYTEAKSNKRVAYSRASEGASMLQKPQRQNSNGEGMSQKSHKGESQNKTLKQTELTGKDTT